MPLLLIQLLILLEFTTVLIPYINYQNNNANIQNINSGNKSVLAAGPTKNKGSISYNAANKVQISVKCKVLRKKLITKKRKNVKRYGLAISRPVYNSEFWHVIKT